jgi:cytochrome P450
MAETAGSDVRDALRDFDHHDIGVDELYALQSRIQEECPVGRSEKWGGFYVVTRYEDVRPLVAAWQDLSSDDGFLLPPVPFKIPAIGYDPPEHGFWRSLFVEVLNAAAVRRFEPRVRAHAEALVDAIAPAGAAEIKQTLAVPLPVVAIFELLGVVEPDRAGLGKQFAEAAIAAANDDAAFMAALGPFAMFCVEEISARRAEPRDDFLTRLATQPAGDALLPDEAIVGILMGFLIAGMHSTSAALTGLLLHVAGDPELRDRLLADRRLVGAAVEEGLRLESPFPYFFRTAARDLDIAGTHVPAGSKVMLSYSGANRDPRVFSAPTTFDIDRGPSPHMAFGHGIHTCVGSLLSRVMLRTALDVVLDRLPGFRLAEGAAPTRVPDGANFVSVDALPVVWNG